jgi:hypothetical protein
VVDSIEFNHRRLPLSLDLPDEHSAPRPSRYPPVRPPGVTILCRRINPSLTPPR